MPVEPDISLVICTHNGARTLALTTAALKAQTIDPARVQVIVVDDASTDDSGDIARAAGYEVLRRDQSSGLSAARNAGVSRATGAIVAFTDDDVEPDPEWLERLTAPFSDPAVDGVTGHTRTASTETIEFRYLDERNPLRPLPGRILTTKTPAQRLANYLATEVGPTPKLEPGERVYNLVGANMAVRREHVTAVGGFDESFVTSSEEEELCVRIHEHLNGANFIYEPQATVAHHYRPGFKDSLRRARHYGHGSVIFAQSKGTMPIIYPFPVAIALLSAGVLVTRPRLAPWLALAPVAAYGRWLTSLPRKGHEAFIYPYMQLAQEVSFTWGEIRSLLRLGR